MNLFPHRVAKYFLAGALIFGLSAGMQSCKDKDDEPNGPEDQTQNDSNQNGEDDNQSEDLTTLEISPSQLTLLAAENSSAQVSITCDAAWTITCSETWLHLSATAGKGNGTITVTALESNYSAQTRVAEVKFSSNTKTETIEVSQMPQLVADCRVEIKNILTLAKSVCYEYEYGKNVSYFMEGMLDASASGWTDQRIIKEMANFDPQSISPEGTLSGFSGLTPNTKYILCFIAFDEQGKQGELVKVPFTTQKDTNDEPTVSIFDCPEHSNSSQWAIECIPNSYTFGYYLAYWRADAAYVIYNFYNTAMMARLIKDEIDNGMNAKTSISKIFTYPRMQGENQFLAVSWAFNMKNEMASKVTGYYYDSTASTSRPALEDPQRPASQKLLPEDIKKLRNSLTIQKVK